MICSQLLQGEHYPRVPLPSKHYKFPYGLSKLACIDLDDQRTRLGSG